MERDGPAGELGEDLQAADDDLDRVQHGRPEARRRSVGWSRCVRQATTARAITTSPTIPATQRCRTIGVVASVSGGTSDPPISGQSGKTSAVEVAVTCDPNSRSAKVRAVVKAASSVNRWLPPRPPIRAGYAGPDRHVDEQRDQAQRGGQVGRHRLPAVAEADGLAPEPGLEPDQGDRGEGRPQDRAPVAVVADGEDREPEDLEADDDRDGPVDPLDPGLGVAAGPG